MPNGVIQSASEYFNDTEKYPGGKGTDTNPLVIADFKDLKAMDKYVHRQINYSSGTSDYCWGGASYLLVNDIDCSEWDPNRDSPIVLRSYLKSSVVIDFNGYSMINIIVRSFNGETPILNDRPGSCFINFKLPYAYSGQPHYNRIFKNMSFKNVIFHNSRHFRLFSFTCNFNYDSDRDSKLKTFFENPKFEVYISEDGTKSSNKFCSIFPNNAKWNKTTTVNGTYIFKVPMYIKNMYLKISGREVMRPIANMELPDYFKRSCVHFLLGFEPTEHCKQYVTDITLNYNDFVFVINEGYGTYGDYKSSSMEKVYNCYSLAPAARSMDTANIIGNMTIRVPKGSSSTDNATSTIDPVYPIQFFRSSEYNTTTPETRCSMSYSNILLNCNVDIVVDDNNSSCAIFDCTDVTYFVNKDRYLLSTVSTGTLNGNYKVFNKFQKAVECTTEQVNNAEYMKNQGLVVFDLNT